MQRRNFCKGLDDGNEAVQIKRQHGLQGKGALEDPQVMTTSLQVNRDQQGSLA
jgi:hypothetical protein